MPQQRGLRQRDALSPILFTLALKLFLHALVFDAIFQSYRLSFSTSNRLHAIKYLAYADDVTSSRPTLICHVLGKKRSHLLSIRCKDIIRDLEIIGAKCLHIWVVMESELYWPYRTLKMNNQHCATSTWPIAMDWWWYHIYWLANMDATRPLETWKDWTRLVENMSKEKELTVHEIYRLILDSLHTVSQSSDISSCNQKFAGRCLDYHYTHQSAFIHDLEKNLLLQTEGENWCCHQRQILSANFEERYSSFQ